MSGGMSDGVIEPLHPMYRVRLDDPNLWQGDIISREKLIENGALKGHQPYIESRVDLVAFCVVTQTCDLVKARCVEFIYLAVIRRLTDVLGKKAVESNKGRGDTRSLLKRIVNHNGNKPGYFFLHAAPAIGDDWVVDLRTVFSLVSRLHYPAIHQSRIVSLDEVFANKLGWMMGNMFARVPTPTWDEMNKIRRKESDASPKEPDSGLFVVRLA
jgi:hypothetical protein